MIVVETQNQKFLVRLQLFMCSCVLFQLPATLRHNMPRHCGSFVSEGLTYTLRTQQWEDGTQHEMTTTACKIWTQASGKPEGPVHLVCSRKFDAEKLEPQDAAARLLHLLATMTCLIFRPLTTCGLPVRTWRPRTSAHK